jgi:hypothetical protein
MAELQLFFEFIKKYGYGNHNCNFFWNSQK